MAEEEEGASSSHIVELDQPAPVDVEKLVAKPRSTSIVWKYFGFEADDKGKPQKTDRPICRLCQTYQRRTATQPTFIAILRASMEKSIYRYKRKGRMFANQIVHQANHHYQKCGRRLKINDPIKFSRAQGHH